MSTAKKQKETAAENVGHVLAHVQDGVDFFVEMGFRALKKLGKDEKVEIVKDDTHPALQQAKKIGKSVVRFFGEAGDAFYNKYEELKSDRNKSGEQK